MGKPAILVTGANGFIGHHLCRKLIENNFSVKAISRSAKPVRLQSLLNKSEFAMHVGDITDRSFIESLFIKTKIDAVFHLAIEAASPEPFSSLPQSRLYQTNVAATANLLHSALNNGVSSWIQSSTMSVYDFENPEYLPVDEKHPTIPKTAYGLTKLLADEICQYYNSQTDLNCVILRYPGVFGLGKNRGIIYRIVRKTIDLEPDPIDVDSNRASDFVYVDDVAQANILAMEKLLESPTLTKQQQIFNIGSGAEISAEKIAEMIAEITNSKININPITSPNPRRFYFDIYAAKNYLNYSPRDIRHSLTDYIENMKMERSSVGN